MFRFVAADGSNGLGLSIAVARAERLDIHICEEELFGSRYTDIFVQRTVNFDQSSSHHSSFDSGLFLDISLIRSPLRSFTSWDSGRCYMMSKSIAGRVE